MNEKLNELMQNEDFVNKLAATKGTSAILSLLAENGVTMTEAELEQAVSSGKAFLKEKGILLENDELSAEGLGMVSGGFSGGMFFAGLGIAAVSAAFTLGGGYVAIGAFMVVMSFWG